MKAWRGRLEAEKADFVDIYPGDPRRAHAGDTDWGAPQIAPKQPSAGSRTTTQRDLPPFHVTARDDAWWDAIDRDEKYQEELENFDRDGPKS